MCDRLPAPSHNHLPRTLKVQRATDARVVAVVPDHGVLAVVEVRHALRKVEPADGVAELDVAVLGGRQGEVEVLVRARSLRVARAW